MTKATEKFLTSGDFISAAAMLRNILYLIEQITWFPLLLDWHQDFGLVRELISDYPSPIKLGPNDVDSVFKRVKQVLSKTCIGGW